MYIIPKCMIHIATVTGIFWIEFKNCIFKCWRYWMKI